ncbi:hypothetical protein RND71_006665 [Anisodus tanguticus]|uniref:Uncharacterized protein n=1 Tax=Anisodus tanguticus TaxID=243964 RepID=A0AAE1SR82_9SOLA|nr:hypothetical protein RND71_006665 [Anisodus tanguticus]
MKIQDNSTLNEIQVQETKATEQAVGKSSISGQLICIYKGALWGMDSANSLSLDAIKPQEEVLINDTATRNIVGQHQQDKVFDINNKPCDDPTQSGNIAEKNSVDSPPKKLDETQIGKIAILEQGESSEQVQKIEEEKRKGINSKIIQKVAAEADLSPKAIGSTKKVYAGDRTRDLAVPRSTATPTWLPLRCLAKSKSAEVPIVCPLSVGQCIVYEKREVLDTDITVKLKSPEFKSVNELVVAVGKGEPAEVMSEYGFALYGCRMLIRIAKPKHIALSNDPCSQRVQAVFVVSDSVDWSRDIQVLCDILRTGGLAGKEISHKPPLFFASDDLAYQALFPSERLGMGALRIALESVFNAVHPAALKYTSYGKPNPFVFINAESVLMQILQSCHNNHQVDGREQFFKTLYMIGDNPSVDIKGARQAGIPWQGLVSSRGKKIMTIFQQIGWGK